MNQTVVDQSQLNWKETIRKYGEEGEAVRMMNIIIENSKKILKLQKTLAKLTNKAKKQGEQREIRRREYKEWQEEKE